MCARTGCEEAPTGKSKYCTPHKAEARETWLATIAAKGSEKAVRDRKWADLHENAHRAGMAAGEAHRPATMIVQRHANMMDDSSPVVEQWVESEGVCGFAWVTVHPGNSSFAIWLKGHTNARTSYQGGVQLWVHEFGQSMERKQAYAQAYAKVVRDAGIKAYSNYRMD
jgi:hypothetical protein